MNMIAVGKRYRFNYPNAFKSLPDYTDYAGMLFVVLRPLVDGVEYNGPRTDFPEAERMYRIRCIADGWEADAFESELEVA